MIHLKINLQQAANFRTREDIWRPAQEAIDNIDRGVLSTRTEVGKFVERRRSEIREALDKVKESRSCLIK